MQLLEALRGGYILPPNCAELISIFTLKKIFLKSLVSCFLLSFSVQKLLNC